MKLHIFTRILTFLAITQTITSSADTGSQSVVFTENKGQVSDQYGQPRADILYSGLTNGMAYHLKSSGISYQLGRVEKWKEDQKFYGKDAVAEEITIYRLDLNWLNTNQKITSTGEQPAGGFSNYYLAVCPDGVLGVKSYKEVMYQNIYNNIDLHYYSHEGSLKYDFIVAPGGDYRNIQLEIKGAESIIMNGDGSVKLTTPLGVIEEGAPLVYQQGKKLTARWVNTKNILSFEIENANPALPLLIDPITRTWGTLCGGTLDDYGSDVDTDSDGNVYTTGTAESMAYIATQGVHQATYGGGRDAFLVKFDKDGIRLWGTYSGGNDPDGGTACAVNNNGAVYMTGYSYSVNNGVIGTPNGHQPTLGGGSYYWSDAFLIKFNSYNGTRIWGTFYGGTSDEYGSGVALDSQGNIYMAGTAKSNSATVISTPGSHQQNYGGGNSSGGDGFLVKFNSNGVRQWGTYYGGGNEEYMGHCTTDAADNVYIVGSTASYNNIASAAAHQTVFAGGGGLFTYDAFTVKFNSSGQRQWGTYYGGTGYDLGYGCTVDNTGNVYISGMSSSSVSGVMTTTNSYEPNFISSAGYAAFLVKFDPAGTRQWGTFYSKGYWTEGRSCAVNNQGNIYMVGFAGNNSGSVLSTPNSHQLVYGGGSSDGLITHFSASGSLLESSYYGGPGSDVISSCVTTTLGYLYVCGSSTNSSGTSIATPGSHQPVNNGLNDAFVVKFFQCDTIPVAPVNTTSTLVPLCVGNAATLTVSGNGSITWYATAIGNSSLAAGPVYVTPTLSAGSQTVYAESKTCTLGQRTAIVFSVSVCTGIPANNLATIPGVNIYPNPSTGLITSNFDFEGEKKIQVFNSLGQIIESRITQNNKEVFNLSGYANGLYYFKVIGRETSGIFKIIITE